MRSQNQKIEPYKSSGLSTFCAGGNPAAACSASTPVSGALILIAKRISQVTFTSNFVWLSVTFFFCFSLCETGSWTTSVMFSDPRIIWERDLLMP